MPDATPSEGPDEALRLASVDNFRDVSGVGAAPMRTADGRPLRRGVYYRSNDLRLADDDHALLSALGLRTIIDLRSPLEIALHPDPEIPGAEAVHVDAAGIPMERLSGLTTRDDAEALMLEVYRTFVTTASSREAFGVVLRRLAEGGPQLFHCSAGKDRTGWVAALLLHVAGVDEATILGDYLLSNDRTAASRAAVEAQIGAALGPERVAVYDPTLLVDERYLRTAWQAAAAEFGDLDGYLREGLGLDDAVLARLRELLVVHD
ncbi:tyrosine-protein phosphatase [Nocardioides sp.]|uniref:tyrosine-protein phosphatase n=1 Tax=Nocardioides sp. TaxID=35761 RepID=UPI0035139798